MSLIVVIDDDAGTRILVSQVLKKEGHEVMTAEDGAKDGAAIASRFLEEMDWSSDALKIQLERCEPILRALAIIQQQKRQVA